MMPAPRILVVEDDREDAFFLERAFRKAGLPGFTRVLADGASAIAYLGGRGEYADRVIHPLPTHLILDLKLPKVSGLEVLGWIRRTELFRGMQIAILSSSGESADRDSAQALGIDGYFVKPSRGTDLLEVVRQIAQIWHLTAQVAPL